MEPQLDKTLIETVAVAIELRLAAGERLVVAGISGAQLWALAQVAGQPGVTVGDGAVLAALSARNASRS